MKEWKTREFSDPKVICIRVSLSVSYVYLIGLNSLDGLSFKIALICILWDGPWFKFKKILDNDIYGFVAIAKKSSICVEKS